MKRKKYVILGLALSVIGIVILQVFSAGHGHVVVVDANIKLEDKNTKLTEQNTKLNNKVSTLKRENTKLQESNNELQTQVTEVTDELQVTSESLQQVNKELKHEKRITSNISSGEQYEFSPIALPVTDSIQR